MSKKGFTLIELMLVTVILGLIVAIALPKFQKMKDRARIATLQSDLRNLMTTQESYFESYNVYATTEADIPDVTNLSEHTDLDLWEVQGQGYGWRARARLRDRPNILCGVFIGSSQGQPSVPGVGPVTEGKIECKGL